MSQIPPHDVPPPLAAPSYYLFSYTPTEVPGRVRFIRSMVDMSDAEKAGARLVMALLVKIGAALDTTSIPLLPSPTFAGRRILAACAGAPAVYTPGPSLWHTVFHWTAGSQANCPAIPRLIDLTEAVLGPAVLSLRERVDFDPEAALRYLGGSGLPPSFDVSKLPSQVHAWCALARRLIL